MLNPAMQQRMDALAVANDARFARAKIKRALGESELTFPRLLVDLPTAATKMKFKETLKCCAGIGEIKAEQIVGLTGISGTRPLGSLTKHEREMIFFYLREHSPSLWNAWRAAA